MNTPEHKISLVESIPTAETEEVMHPVVAKPCNERQPAPSTLTEAQIIYSMVIFSSDYEYYAALTQERQKRKAPTASQG